MGELILADGPYLITQKRLKFQVTDSTTKEELGIFNSFEEARNFVASQEPQPALKNKYGIVQIPHVPWGKPASPPWGKSPSPGWGKPKAPFVEVPKQPAFDILSQVERGK